MNTRDIVAGAIYAFGAWLTTREETIQVGAKENAAIMADLVVTFLAMNNVLSGDPAVKEWQDNLGELPYTGAEQGPA